ncbi:hypothetical protein AGABI1DRAFT_106672 [Agaricus bisporus var. burnettii JB137-S8]|uniref:Uncharacterized protein n=1 Tax=Agaricus bisporus var. burnettii (strain JB137-S8 / ATCC MYA-4627 / FGSC 10392) TaxID=597362 RepID=K5VX62_AGABU|nr:uncharacterized protein AGABI1DRAFT_106672 [Agaricus bisporus var. burnettii JB137-S8]EKM79059.1 hypothetical protein AGABI1DRAFT_106672 [Agaricus bisporus var. burnettii JB137-S8]
MPSKPKRPKAKSDAVVPSWADHVNLDELNENQRQFLFANSGSALAILATLQHKGSITSWNPPHGGPLDVRPFGPDSIIPAPNTDWDADGGELFDLLRSSLDPSQTTSTLGKWPQPPSPAPSTSLAAGTPPAKAGDDQDMRSPESPTPASASFWGVYFRNLENALATLDPTHHQSARYLITMLTGLQKIVHDERYLSLQVDGGFTIADLIDALPDRSSVVQPTHPPRVQETGPRPTSKPPPKKVKFNPPSPLAKKASAPASADTPAPAVESWHTHAFLYTRTDHIYYYKYYLSLEASISFYTTLHYSYKSPSYIQHYVVLSNRLWAPDSVNEDSAFNSFDVLGSSLTRVLLLSAPENRGVVEAEMKYEV